MTKIYIDDRWGKTGGIGTFSEELNKITQYESAGFKGAPFSPLDTFKTSAKLIKKTKGLYFFPGYIPPLISRCPFVFTIHDLNHLDRPENSNLFKRFFYNTVILRGCRKASFVFTVSEFSKERIIEWSGIDADKVINVGNGVSDIFTRHGDVKKFDFDYFLCVGNRKTHKNDIRVLEAFSKAKISKNMKMIFTGASNTIIDNKIKELNISNRVVFTGYINTSDLPALYRGAKALVFASLYEGFGLPVIEAMACGTPVITSNTTSLGEVANNSALLVNPESVSEITSAMEVIVKDEEKRNELIISGSERAKCFTWTNVAQKVSKALSSLIN